MKIKINGQYYSFFDEVSIQNQLDAVASTFSFKARFNPENAQQREIFRPLSYQLVEIFNDNDELILKGRIINTSLTSGPTRELQVVSGYSLAGILEDVSIDYSLYPLERNNVSLKDICDSLLGFYGIGYVIDPSAAQSMNLTYEKTSAEPTETVKDFITKLAAQRNILISHNAKGNLVFFKLNDKAKPKIFLNDQNSLSMSVSVNGQSLHSKITVIRQPSKDNPTLAPVDSVVNSFIGLNRPIVKTLSSGTETETKTAADNLLAAELKNISFTVETNRRYDEVKCGDIIQIHNHEIFVHKYLKLVVAGITRVKDINSDKTTFNLLLPESFTGKIPKNPFNDNFNSKRKHS